MSRADGVAIERLKIGIATRNWQGSFYIGRRESSSLPPSIHLNLSFFDMYLS
jgi:hypothetical protein